MPDRPEVACPEETRAELVARFDVEEAERYQDGGALGRGGMGEVRAVVDLRLNREVALKVLHAADQSSEARLAREANLAARLEHPGIVPIYSAGRLPDGRAYYTMRVVRGRSLAQILKTTPVLSDRLRLMRHVLDACEAVAYAHDQGVLHRDIKPANVMVGDHGETAVVDWGLATTLGRPAVAVTPKIPARTTTSSADTTWGDEVSTATPSRGADSEHIGSATGTSEEITMPGQIMGTPAYMPPEQARGEALDKRADVFALGGILYAVLSGSAPREGDNPHSPVPPLSLRCPEAPPELAAIATRAMAFEPDLRYADAGAMAADLEAWFDGRRVAAFNYSVWQHLRRVYTAWRTPILVGAVAFVALTIAVGVGWWRTTTERNRAIEAEHAAQRAQESSDRSLASALVAQARIAANQGKQAEAEVLAGHRLRYGESPEARGILARFGAQPRPHLLSRVPLPFCQSVISNNDANLLACLQDDHVLVVRAADGCVVKTLTARPFDAAFSADSTLLFVSVFGEGVITWDLSTDRTRPLYTTTMDATLDACSQPGKVFSTVRSTSFELTAATGEARLLSICPRKSQSEGATLELGGGRYGAICATGAVGDFTLYQNAKGETSEALFAIRREEGLPFSMAADTTGRITVGLDSGMLVFYDANTGKTSRIQTELSGLPSVTVSGDRVAASGSRGGVVVVDMARGRTIARIPATDGASVRWTDNATLRVIGQGIQDWAVPELSPPHRYDHAAGVAAVAISPDGRRIASAHGQGSVYVYDRASGAKLFETSLPGAIAKDLAFSPNGDRLAVAAAGLDAASVILSLDDENAPVMPDLPGLRRIAWVGSELFVAPYVSGLLSLQDTDALERVQAWPMPNEVGDMDAFSDGSGLIIVDQKGQLFRLDLAAPGRHLARIGDAPNARAIAATSTSIWQILPRSVIRQAPDGTELARVETPGSTPTTEIAAAPGDRRVAVGLFDGTVLILDGQTLALQAVLHGHDSRVGSAAFDASGRWLVTGGWDGAMLVWDMSVLDSDAATLLAPIELAWGLSLDTVLAVDELKAGSSARP